MPNPYKMTQLIITLLIVFVATAIAVFLIVKSFRKKGKKEDVCGGCSSDCGECGFYKELEKNKKI
jgi:hypothetical protein